MEADYVPLSENGTGNSNDSKPGVVELLERKLTSNTDDNLTNEDLGFDKYGSLNTLKLLPDFVEYYNATRSLRWVMRILSLWHPHYSKPITKALYPYLLWSIILFPWAHFFIREGAVDDSYHNSVAFGVGKLLTIACFYLARRYFARSHFVQIIVSVFDPKSDVYRHFDGEDNKAAQKTRKSDRRRMFNRIVNKSLVLFYVQVLIATVCYMVFIVLTSGEERDPWIITLDVVNIFCTAVGTAVFAFLAAFSKLIFRFHVMDVRRHLSLYTIHERRRGSLDQAPTSLAPSSFLGKTDEQPVHPHELQLRGRQGENLNSVLAFHDWRIDDIRFLDSKLPILLRDYMRMSRDVRRTSRTFRLFLVMVFLLSIIGGLLSMFILLEDLRRSQYSYFSVHFPNILNLYFSLSVLSTAAKIAHKAHYISVKVSEFNAYAALHSDESENARASTATVRSAALVQLVNNKPIYVSLYGISLDRNMAFAFLSPLVALTLFIVQKALTGS